MRFWRTFLPATVCRDSARKTRAIVLATAGAAVATGVFAIPGAVGSAATATPQLTSTVTAAGPVLAGVPVTFTITVTNGYLRTVAAVQVQDFLPAGLALDRLLNPDVCARTNKPVLTGTAFNCSAGALAPGAKATVRFTATAAQPFTYVDTVRSTGSLDAVTVGNSTTVPIKATPGPTDVQVGGAASTGSPQHGSPFVLTFQVRDSGPQVAYGVALVASLPAGLTPLRSTTDVGTCNVTATAVRCAVGDLAVGRQASIAVTALASVASASATVVASASMLGPDTRPASNTVRITVAPR